MKTIIHTVAILAIVSAVFLTGCKQSMIISNVDYSQSIESVLTPNDEGMVADVQNGLKFNIKPLQYAETQDTSSITTSEVRYIRGQEGYYYITAPNYEHVYVMLPEKNKLKLKNKLTVLEGGLDQPAFNQRVSHIQLLNQKSGESWKIKPDGVQKGESQLTKREDQ